MTCVYQKSDCKYEFYHDLCESFSRMYQQKGRRNNFVEVPVSKVKSIIKEAREIHFPWDAIPEPTQSWLQAMAGAINTQPEFILLGALTVTSCLMGSECKVEICPRHLEPCNIFTACLCEPGTGKTQAYKVAVETPLQHIPSKILVHDYTSKGLFEHLKTREGMVSNSIYTSACNLLHVNNLHNKDKYVFHHSNCFSPF